MTEQWVIDASVIAKVYLKDEEHTDLAQDLVGRYVAGSVELIAPQFILYEVPSTILAAVRRRRLHIERGYQAIREFFELGLPLVGDDATLQPMIEAAYDFAQDTGCKIYDALYLVAAKAFDCAFITADAKLFRALSGQIDYLAWIGDYEPQVQASP